MRLVSKTLMALRLGALNVDRGENGEHIRLDNADENLDCIDDKENRRKHERRNGAKQIRRGKLLDERLREQRHHEGERTQNNVAREHVAEQTNGKRNGAKQGGDELDQPNEDVEREHNPLGSEALNIAPYSVVLHTDADKVNEDNEGERRSG